MSTWSIVIDAQPATSKMAQSYILHLFCFCWLALGTVAAGYLPNEMECPVNFDPEIFSRKYWVPPGVPYRAWRTIPSKLFTIKASSIPNAGLGVFANTFILKNTWLAEYEGVMISAKKAESIPQYSYIYAWRVYVDDVVTHYVDAMDQTLSNWLRFVNCPRHYVEENVEANTCYGHIYYRTMRDILPGEELLIYYGDDYAIDILGIDVEKYSDIAYYADLKTEITQRKDL